MAYDAPTVAEFKARFPTVAGSKSDPTIQAFLDEATNTIDTTWREADYKIAIMYLAAHNMTLEDNAASGGGGAVASGVVASESFGGMSISYDNSKGGSDAAANSEWGATFYGQQFYLLLKRNKPAIVVI
jgi:hypothetical protein